MTVAIRPPRKTDQSYIANSWVSCLAGPRAQWGAKERELNSQIDALLDDPRTRLLIACEATDEDSIVGWIAFARIPGARVVEFVMVRRQRRREGIGRLLMTRAELIGPLMYLYETQDWQYLKPPTAVHIEPGDFL